MIEYIRGEVAELTPTLAVIDCQGVGYGLNISLTTYSTLAIGREARLYVYEAIREDAHLLYGLSTGRNGNFSCYSSRYRVSAPIRPV